MENGEPNLVVPCPFPLEPSEVLERSGSLDVTPERPFNKRKRSHRKKDKAGQQGSTFPCTLHPCHHPVDLCTPQLNSTAHLLNRLHAMKQEAEEKHYGDDGEVVIGPSKTSCNGEPRVPALHQVGDLESMIQRPLKEVNVPRNATRYKDLIPIDVSDESFQRLTFKPRKARNTKWSSAATDAPKEPKVMDFMVPGLECEEADWSRGSSSGGGGGGSGGGGGMEQSRPVRMDCNDVYALQDFIRSLKH